MQAAPREFEAPVPEAWALSHMAKASANRSAVKTAARKAKKQKRKLMKQEQQQLQQEQQQQEECRRQQHQDMPRGQQQQQLVLEDKQEVCPHEALQQQHQSNGTEPRTEAGQPIQPSEDGSAELHLSRNSRCAGADNDAGVIRSTKASAASDRQAASSSPRQQQPSKVTDVLLDLFCCPLAKVTAWRQLHIAALYPAIVLTKARSSDRLHKGHPVLCRAVLCCAALCCAMLCCAVLPHVHDKCQYARCSAPHQSGAVTVILLPMAGDHG